MPLELYGANGAKPLCPDCCYCYRSTHLLMTYFSPKFIAFFKGLQANNTSEWFADHKRDYENEVKKPFIAFLTDLIARAQVDEPELQQLPKDAVFRINRDVRFSKDKRPYKEHVSAIINRYGKKSPLPGFYLQFGGSEAWIGGGAYEIEKEALANIRSEIHYNGAEFRELLAADPFKQHYGGVLLGDRNKILPEPYKSAVADEPYLANKQFYYMATLPSQELLLRPDLLDYVYAHMIAARPINAFLTLAMQPGQEG